MNKCTIWFTGLSGAGKTTLAYETQNVLSNKGIKSYVIDGDKIRKGLNRDLGFSKEDRSENIRRIAEVAKILNDAGIVSIVSAISPYKIDRQFARDNYDGDFVEVFLDCPVEVCQMRDSKGLYKKANEGTIKEFTGIDAPYEKPDDSEVFIRTDLSSIEESIECIFYYLSNFTKVLTNIR